MNKKEIAQAEELINTPITAENVNQPVFAVFPAIEMAVCLSCGAEEYDVPQVDTGTGPRIQKKCDRCSGQLVSNPRRG